MGLFEITRTYRNLVRLAEIVRILTRHGFGELFERVEPYPQKPGGYLCSGFRGLCDRVRAGPAIGLGDLSIGKVVNLLFLFPSLGQSEELKTQ